MDNFYNIEAVNEMIGQDSKKFSGKTILWTGTSGFLGQWILRTIQYLNKFANLIKGCKITTTMHDK